jgi:hypothetical protein
MSCCASRKSRNSLFRRFRSRVHSVERIPCFSALRAADALPLSFLLRPASHIVYFLHG